MNCIIIEDQMPAQRILKKYISDIGSLNLIGTFTDAIDAIELLKTGTVELMFLDIHLPKLSGIEFLKTLSNPPKVILTTAFQEYALESYELDVVDYLLKPFSFQRFVKAISKVSASKSPESYIKQEVEKKQPNDLYIKSGHDHIRIDLNYLYFIRSDADYTELHLDDKMHLSTETLKHWEDILPSDEFMRIHKSYIINTTKIKKVSGNQVSLSNNDKVPIGRAYKQAFSQRFLDH